MKNNRAITLAALAVGLFAWPAQADVAAHHLLDGMRVTDALYFIPRMLPTEAVGLIRVQLTPS